MPNSPTERTGKVQLNVNLPKILVIKFKSACSDEKRQVGAQLEIVLEEWLRRREVEKKVIYESGGKIGENRLMAAEEKAPYRKGKP